MKKVLIIALLIGTLTGCSSISDATFIDGDDGSKVNLDLHSNEESYIIGNYDIKSDDNSLNDKSYEFYDNQGPNYGDSYWSNENNTDMNKVTN